MAAFGGEGLADGSAAPVVVENVFHEQIGEPVRGVVLAKCLSVLLMDETFVERTQDIASLAAPFVTVELFEKGGGPLEASVGREDPCNESIAKN